MLVPGIPHNAGLKALNEKLEKRSDKKVPSADLVDMTGFVLKKNFFEFDSKVKQQVSSTTVEIKIAPPYVCIFMDKVEIDFLETQTVKPLVWLRYIGEIFYIWNKSEEKLQEIFENLTNFHPNLKFTSAKSKESVNFLDVTVSLIDQPLETDLYCKPTNCHQFLDFNSAHPIYTKKSIVYSQGLRIKRLCSSSVAFENLESLKGWLQNTGYPKILVNNQLKRVTEARRTSDQIYKRGNGVPLVLIYHPRLNNVNDIIKKHLVFLYAKEQVENIFTPPFFVSIRAGFFYVNVNHLAVTKVDVRLALMLQKKS